MIIDCGKVEIDTDLNWEEHRKIINKKTHCFCDDDDPVQWFTQREAREGGSRYYHLHYNKDGTELKRITSWDEAPDVYKEVKKVKGEDNICYFTKNDHKLEYCMVKEKDYDAPSSENTMTHWEKGWNPEKAKDMVLPKKKHWWNF